MRVPRSTIDTYDPVVHIKARLFVIIVSRSTAFQLHLAEWAERMGENQQTQGLMTRGLVAVSC